MGDGAGVARAGGMSGVVIGVDGGGSGCRAVLVDPEGRELARAEGGPAVADGRPDGPAVAAVGRVCRTVLDRAGAASSAAALWAGLAGAGREGARGGVEDGLRALQLARRVRVGTDVDAAFQDVFGQGPGLLLVAGTGSVGRGRGPGGSETRVGGWGPMLGDEGSGYALGLEGLREVVRAADGRGLDTRLTATLLADLGLSIEGPGDEVGHLLVEWIAGASRDEVARLAPRVVETATEGDLVAATLVAGAVDALVRHAAALGDELGPWPDPPRVALAGGLLAPGRPLCAPLTEALAAAGFEIVAGPLDAARGAAELARRLI
jgi:glucosamine kinase